MKERLTPMLLAAVVVLLAASYLAPLRVATVATSAQVPEPVPAVLRAQAIELVDKAGKVIAQLYVGEDGGGNIRLRSADGTVRVKLGATNNGSGLLLLDKDTEPAVTLGSNQAGTSLTLAERGKPKRVITP
jgi:hypothetical protein